MPRKEKADVMTDDAKRKKVKKNPIESHLGYHLRRASMVMLADLGNTLSDLGLRVTDASVVMVIHTNKDITQSDICRLLGLKPANLVPVITQLEMRNLVCRTDVTGRAQALRLTLEGEALAQECVKRIMAHEAKFFVSLNTDQRAGLIALLHSIWAK